ncbi:MAG TPA: methyltransferase domain-containing protein, partial [Aquella sp.]|nr:methyltransferase domain-containing protein [Aquella sp.]
YIANAEIQRTPALAIINLLSKYYKDGIILDLGSGPGTLAHNNLPSYPTLIFDLSLSMLKMSDTYYHRVGGDAGNLPFAANSFPIIISNLMLQWPHNKEQVVSEAWRVLRPGGKLILTTLINPSLHELKYAWLQVDNKEHTLEFLNNRDYVHLFMNAGFRLDNSISWQTVVYFLDLSALLRHFKSTGTSLVKSSSNVGLGGKKQIQQLNQAYKTLPDGQLPLTYVYLLMTATKEVN